MASQEDDNKLESKSNVNKDQERNFINVYKKYEYILKSKLEPFPKKIESLIEIWKSLSQCNQQNSEIGYIIQIMDWAKLHTLNIVLTGKWKMFKGDFEGKLLSEVEKTQNELIKISDVFSKKFQKLSDVIRNPWDDPVLANLLHDNNATIGQPEIEFFSIETAYLVSVRLKKLCESQCEDLALNLVTAFMNCYNLSQTENFSLNATKTQVLFCFDIHVALLYRYSRRSDIVALFKKLSLDEGLDLIRRFAKKRVKISKVWRNYPEITFLASQVFVTAAVTKPIEESGIVLRDLLDIWIAFSMEHAMLDKVEASVRRIIQAATGAQHIYICCEFIHNKLGLKMKTFTIELYIRALTTDMNNLELQKTENDLEKVEETTKRLANGFYNLADILKDNIQVSRECALTAFSLEPTLERLSKIEDLARLSGFKVLDTGQIWKCKLHPPATPADEVTFECKSCGDWMCTPSLDLHLSTNFALNEALNFETLGISSQLCDDLAVVLNGPRYHLLSWLLRWEDLHRLCEMYLNDMERTKNLVTDLKFVDIDYSMFATIKPEPVEEHTGIEKGYEEFLYADEQLVNMIENSTPDPPPEIPPQAKSDPNTLKTLRMFRHNIKRTKPQVTQTNVESNNIISSVKTYPPGEGKWMSLQSYLESERLKDIQRQKQRLANPTLQKNNGACNSSLTASLADVFFNGCKYTNFSTENRTTPSNKSLDVRDLRVNQHNSNRRPIEYSNCHSPTYGNINTDPSKPLIPSNLFPTAQSMIRSVTPPPRQSSFSPPKYSSHNLIRSAILARYGKAYYGADLFRKSPKLDMQNHQAENLSCKPFTECSSSSMSTSTSSSTSSLSSSPLSSSSSISTPSNFNQDSQNVVKSDKILPQSSNTMSNDIKAKPQNLIRHDLFTSQTPLNKDVLSQLNAYRQRINETLSPSSGFPSFDKIPAAQNAPMCDITTKDNPNNERPDQVTNTKSGSYLNKDMQNIHTTSTVPKNDNPFTINEEAKTNFKRPPSDQGSNHVITPEKKLKCDNGQRSNGISFSDHKEACKDQIIRALLSRGTKKKTDVSVQNENSSKNANCCLPATNNINSTNNNSEDNPKSDNKMVNVINSKTPILKSTQAIHNKVPAKTPLKTHPDISSKPGQADTKLNKETVKNNYVKEINQSKNLLLKSISEKHIPMIVEKTSEEKNSKTNDSVKTDNLNNNSSMEDNSEVKEASEEKQVQPKMISDKTKVNQVKVLKDVKEMKIDDEKETEENIFTKTVAPLIKEEATKPNHKKELKIILHRLSSEVIRSFIPDYKDDSQSSGNIVKRSKGRPRKLDICKYNPSDPVFQTYDNDKYSLRTFRKISDRRDNHRQDNSDMRKKTGSNKNMKKFGGKHKKIINGNHKRDKFNKAEKNFTYKDKYITSRKSDIEQIEANMNPRVVLERLDANYVRSVLSNVPGLNDYEMLRPTNVDHIVNVVQISGGRSTSTVPVQNTQTSTQITPHIQRIGQPRSDKPEHNTNNEIAVTSTITTTSTSTTIKPSTSQPSTLINILSQQIIRPGQSNCVRNRSSPLINILSQQIIRPATTQNNKSAANSSTDGQANQPKVQTTVEQSTSNEGSPVKAVTTTNTPPSGQGTILQFICKSSLPEFQQAFGKSVYQSNTETGDPTSTCSETVTNTTETNKKSPTKNSAVNIQPIQGGVIYTRQMPVGQTINLIPPTRGQVFRIATSNADKISLVKDTVIHSKMSALLAAALQGKQKTTETQSDGESTTDDGAGTRVTVTRPTLVQNARIVKPVLQIPSNVIRSSPQSNMSSTTLEQLREFDMVYKQIKERSSTSTPSETNTTEANENNSQQRISVTYLNQQGQKYTQLSPVVVVSSYCNLQPAASPALSVTSQGSSSPCVTPAPTPSVPKVSSKSSKGKTVKNTTTQASKASPIPKPQQKPQEDEHTTQRIFDILAEYAEQLRNSPDLNNKPAPRRRSNPPTNPSQNSKRKKSSSSKKSGQCSSMVSDADIEDHRTVGSEDSSCGVVQISVQEEEQTHMQTITTESNDSTSGSRQQLILTDASTNQTRNLIIADSSVGEALKMPNTAVLVPGNYIMPVSMVKGGQQIAVVSGGSKILATVPARSGPNMLLFQSFLNQNRNKTGVPTVKYSTIQPISGISSQNIAGVSGQPPVILPPNSHNLTAVTLGQPITLKKMDETDRVNTELLLTISQPRDNGNSSSESATHPDSTNTVTSTVGNIELEETIIHSDNSSEKVFHTYQKSITTAPIATPVIAQTACAKEDIEDEQNTAQSSIGLNITPDNNKNDSSKTLERVQSVLVTACTSNGPMLSHSPPRYRKPSDSACVNSEPGNKEEFLHNGEKQNNNQQKQFQGNASYYQNKNKKIGNNNPQRLDRELHQLCLQRKQAAIERELRLQKSLSEECEDLGVDEPSTSDLFPEADILFDANHSPSFDQSSQDLVKRPTGQEMKESENKTSMALFTDDDEGTLRTDFLFEPVEYQRGGNELVYDQNQQLTNGQSSASNESGSTCGEDHTLLQNCASMSDVTLNSPVSPDPYHENTPSLNKYKFKYSNRRKGERHKQSCETWNTEVSSSEDTTGSTELGKSSSHSPESCTNKRSHSISCDDELSDGSYKVVRVAISKSDLLKDDESCEELHCEDDLDCSPSGRGARRSVKKMCSCCNGSQDGGGSRKRPASRPHTPAPHKKAFLNKKR